MKAYDSILECQVYMADMRSKLEDHEMPEPCHCTFCVAARDEIQLAWDRILAIEAGSCGPYEYC